MFSIFKNIHKIAKNEGVTALWRGLPPTLIGIVHPLVFFPCYEKLKLSLQRTGEDKLRPMSIVVATLLSKTLASLLSYPHEVVRTRLYYKVQKETMISVVTRMLATEGYLSLYSGFFANLARILPNSVIMFMLYEWLSVQFGLKNE